MLNQFSNNKLQINTKTKRFLNILLIKIISKDTNTNLPPHSQTTSHTQYTTPKTNTTHTHQPKQTQTNHLLANTTPYKADSHKVRVE